MTGQRNALVALGSNEGARERTLRAALVELSTRIGGPVLASALYETRPEGMRPGARKVVNAVCRFRTDLQAEELLELLREMETEAGRRCSPQPSKDRPAPDQHDHAQAQCQTQAQDRTLDLDLLLLGRKIVKTPTLTVPHPRMHLRAFVLVPACEIAADWMHPVYDQTLEELLRALPQTEILSVQAGQRPMPDSPTE